MPTTTDIIRAGDSRTGQTGFVQGKRAAERLWFRAWIWAYPHRQTISALAPGVVYLAIRLFGLLVLVWLCATNGKSPTDSLTSWDGQWYLEIAAHGYGGVNPTMVDGHGHRSWETPLAFFPGYPVLVRAFAMLPGFSVAWAGVTVSLVAGVIGAYALARLGRAVGGTERVGLLFVALFAASPMSVVLSMAYSEALFCALSAWALVGVLERRWLLAGLCCAGAGLIRPTALALVVVVAVAAVVAMRRERDGLGPRAALLLAPAGMLGYIGWVASVTGRLTGYFALQAHGWSSQFDFGLATLRFAIQALSRDSSVLEVLTVWISLISLVLLVLCFRARMPWPLIAFAAAVLILDLGSNGLMYSKVRLLLPAFPLLLPVATGLAKRRTTTAVCTLALVVFFGAWFGAYSITAWKYAI